MSEVLLPGCSIRLHFEWLINTSKSEVIYYVVWADIHRFGNILFYNAVWGTLPGTVVWRHRSGAQSNPLYSLVPGNHYPLRRCALCTRPAGSTSSLTNRDLTLQRMSAESERLSCQLNCSTPLWFTLHPSHPHPPVPSLHKISPFFTG